MTVLYCYDKKKLNKLKEHKKYKKYNRQSTDLARYCSNNEIKAIDYQNAKKKKHN